MRYNLSLCRHCRRYGEQVRAIGTSVRSLSLADSADPPMIDRSNAESWSTLWVDRKKSRPATGRVAMLAYSELHRATF